ncbi:hypothetical protein HMF8227_01825 [Saliniradius amylolyticus]|uniref:Uncharacterized protein n=1 Tax=Saliniradius amylolyticus TaxID=2183582 RepID=A0A2S2E3R9_9ALTE|nr:hypothetical protein [Saliniradius amylolyticus]AWL12298.1 hypothetical protein HMF8227_01825 [Saliniradius amylolyticus]
MDIQRSVSATHQGLAVNGANQKKPSASPVREVAPAAEQEQPKRAEKVRQGNAELQFQADRFRHQSAFYDQPPRRGQQAIDAYQTLAREEKRAEIQSMMGVDTFA